MNYVALNQQQLSRFSHHWFWGLRVDMGDKNTLYDEIVRLQGDDLLCESKEGQIAQIGIRPLVVRAVYWFFNIGQYRANYYQLQAYYSWQCYQKGAAMFSEQDQKLVNASGVFIVTLGAALAMKVLSPYMKEPLNWFTHKILSYFPSQDKIKVVEATDLPHAPKATPLNFANYSSLGNSGEIVLSHHESKAFFIVNELMFDALQTLGVMSGVGDSVLFSVLRSAYRKSCLRTHPDKGEGGTQEAFIAVTQAYAKIVSLIERGLLSKNASVNLGANQFNEMNHDLAKMKEETIQMQKEMEEASCSLRELLARSRQQTEQIKSQNEQIKKQREQIKGQTEQIKGQTEQIKGQTEQIKELIVGFSELDRQQREINAAKGLPPLTQADIDGFHEDPDYFNKKKARAELQEDVANANRFFAGVLPEANEEKVPLASGRSTPVASS